MNISLANGWSIRSFEESDIPSLVKYANNRHVWKNLMETFPHPYTETDAQDWITHVRSQEPETNFAIASEEELIGGIGFDIQRDVHRKSSSLGYWLGEPFWGQGIATRAVTAITHYIFQNYDIVRIYASVFYWNPASGRVLEKAGYIYEGRLRKHVYKDNRITDLLMYAILRDEWQGA